MHKKARHKTSKIDHSLFALLQNCTMCKALNMNMNYCFIFGYSLSLKIKLWLSKFFLFITLLGLEFNLVNATCHGCIVLKCWNYDKQWKIEWFHSFLTISRSLLLDNSILICKRYAKSIWRMKTTTTKKKKSERTTTTATNVTKPIENRWIDEREKQQKTRKAFSLMSFYFVNIIHILLCACVSFHICYRCCEILLCEKKRRRDSVRRFATDIRFRIIYTYWTYACTTTHIRSHTPEKKKSK